MLAEASDQRAYASFDGFRGLSLSKSHKPAGPVVLIDLVSIYAEAIRVIDKTW